MPLMSTYELSRMLASGRKLSFGMARHHLGRVAACAEKIKEVYENRDEAILEAWESGETYRDIAKAAGISHQRVAQIVKGSRELKYPEGF